MAQLDDMLADLQARYGGAPADTTVASLAPAPVAPAPPVPQAPQVPQQAAPLPPVPGQAPAPLLPTPSTAVNAGLTPYEQSVTGYESNNDPNAQNPNSSAGGRFQITDATYADLQRKHPDHQYTGKNDVQAMHDLTTDNTQALRLSLGRPPTSMEIYAAHFLGPTGATRFLQAPSDTPVDQVVSPDALAANHKIFYDPQGKPYTTGQVESMVSQNVFKGGQGAQGNAPAGSNVGSSPQTPGDALYGQQKQDISSYIAGQPAMWSKLADLQNQYKKAATPTVDDRLADAMTQFQMQNSVAQAGSHATAGGILNHQLPSADDFNKALQASHTIDTDARTARTNLAQQDYQMQSGALQAQNTQNAANLGLTGSLAKDTGEYNLNSGANALKLAQFNLDQQKAVGEQLEKLVPNPETRAVVSAAYDQQHNPQGGYQQNMQILNGIIQKVQAGTPGSPGTPAQPAVAAQDAIPDPNAPGIAGAPAIAAKPAVAAVAPIPGAPGMQISAKEPAKMMSITTFDPAANDGAGGQKLETVNAATPEGQMRLKQVAMTNPNAKITDLSAPQNNVSVGGAGEGAGAGAGASGGSAPLAAQHAAAGETMQAAQAALTFLPYIEAHGGTGVLTDTPEGKAIASGIKQATGFDATGLPVREVYDKLLQQVQNGLTTPGLKAFGGRPAAAEFKILQAGQLGATATTQAATAFLNHVVESMNYSQNKLEAQSDAQLKARQQNNTYFDPDNWAIKYQKTNLPPVWHGQGLLDAVQGTPATATAPGKAPTDVSVPLLSPSTAGGLIDWARKQTGLPPTSAESAPVPAPSGPRLPMTPDEQARFTGGQ